MKMVKVVSVVCSALLLASSASFAAEPQKGGFIANLKNKYFSGQKQDKTAKPAVAAVPAAAKNAAVSKAPIQKPQVVTTPDAAKPVLRKFSKEETISYISDTLNTREDVLAAVPELKVSKDSIGRKSYSYTQDGVTKNLEDMDEESLTKLMHRVVGEMNRIQSERMQKQIQQMQQQQRQIQQIQQQQQQQQQLQQTIRQNQQVAAAASQRPVTPPRPPSPPPAPPRR